MLERLGYEVEVAVDGAEALAMYQKAQGAGEPFDVVILDLTIPGGMGGKETIEKLLEIDRDVKAVVSSGYSEDPVLSNFEEYGFRGVVSKPYKVEQLSEVLHRVMSG